jgi:zinc protease
VTLRRVGDVQLVMTSYHVPAGSHSDAAALDVLTSVLGDSPSGRLYKALVDNKKAASASMGSAGSARSRLRLRHASVRVDQSLDEAKDILLKTIENLAAEPPTKEEVDRAKTRILKQIELSLTNPEMIGIYMSEWASMGDWRLMFLNRDQVKKVTPDDVLRVAKAYFKPQNRTLGLFIPTKESRPGRDSGYPGCHRSAEGFQGRGSGGAGRGVRSHSGQHRRPPDPLETAQRPEGRDAAEADSRRHRSCPGESSLRRREIAVRQEHRGQDSQARC